MRLFSMDISVFIGFLLRKSYWAIFCSEACSHLLEFFKEAENVLLTENDARKKYIHA